MLLKHDRISMPALMLPFIWAAFMVAGCTVPARVQFDESAREIQFQDRSGRLWLAKGVVHIVLSDGERISSTDHRFRVQEVPGDGNITFLFIDQAEQLDLELAVETLDDGAVLATLTAANRSREDLKVDRIEILQGQLTGERDPRRSNVLLNGENSWSPFRQGKLRGLGSTLESYYTLAIQTPPLAAGFLTGRHNINRFSLLDGADGIVLTAWGECNGCVLHPGAARTTDSIFLSTHPNPLAQMERFADLAAQACRARIWPENFATWCSWYAGWIRQNLHEYKGGLEKGIEQNIPRVKKLFGSRGGASMRMVDDSDEMPYGDWDEKTKAIPGGFPRLAHKMHEEGIQPGYWLPVYMVSDRSRLFLEHPEWLQKKAGGSIYTIPFYGNTCAVMDTSQSEAMQYFQDTAARLRAWGMRYVMTDFLRNSLFGQVLHDPELTKAQMHRLGLEAFRQGLGPDVYWLGCGALLGPSMGLVDGMRISGDSHGDQIFSYQWSGARWFYNRKLWLNDPDAIVCSRYGEAKSVEWNRAWMSWMALAGSVLTYGDTFDNLPKEHVAIYQRIFPPLNVAGRPLDLWENNPYLLWGMDPGEADGPYVLFGIFHFAPGGGRQVELNLDEISLRCQGFDKPSKCGSLGPESACVPQAYLLWDFWEQKRIRVEGSKLSLPLPSRGSRIFALRGDLGRPQMLGTSGHFSQGALETSCVQCDPKGNILSGQVRGNGGDATTIFFSLPQPMGLKRVVLNGEEVEAFTIEPSVIALHVPPVKEPVPFSLSFTGHVEKIPRTREFVRGRAATLLGDDPASAARKRTILESAPPGETLLAYLNCGEEEISDETKKVRIELIRGSPWTWTEALHIQEASPSFASAFFDNEQVVFLLHGLDAEKRHTLGLTWWDFDDSGRTQAVRSETVDGTIQKELLQPSVLPKYAGRKESALQMRLDLPPELYRDSCLKVIITNVAGVNVVVSEIWLMENKSN